MPENVLHCETFWNPKTIVWVSCGAASAVAAKMATESVAHADLILCYCDSSKEEHPDNARFRSDLERWFGFPITVIKSKDYDSPSAVFVGEQYMVGPRGARCTTELKKIPRLRFAAPEDFHIFGFTSDEGHRIKLFESRNPDMRLLWPLRDAGISKSDCLQRLRDAGIALPVMYSLGFDHNNCIACVKSQSPAYWNLTRKHFPAQFQARAELSRRMGVRLVKVAGELRFLDELPESDQTKLQENLSCGPECGTV